MAKTCSIDRLIQTTRQQWAADEFNSHELSALGSASQPLIIEMHSTALCGLQSVNDFTGMGDWIAGDNNTDDTLMAAA
jgi:hypothetical protein